MKSSPDLLILPGQEGSEVWRVRGSEPVQPESAPLGKGSPGWIGLPTPAILSLPVHLLATDATQQKAAVQLELEAAGISSEDLTVHRLDIQPLDPSGRDGTSAVFLFDGSLPDHVEAARALDSRFAPAFCFHRLKSGTVSLWQESTRWVIGIPHESGRILHAQALCSRELDADAAAEIRCILAALELSEVLPRLNGIQIELADGQPPPDVAFLESLPLPVELQSTVPPLALQGASPLVPDDIVQARDDRRRQRTLISTLCALMLVVAAALSAFAARLYVREQAITLEREALDSVEPEVQAVRDAQTQFGTLDPTLNRDQFIVEMFHQLVNLLPPEGIRLTRFEFRSDSLIIDGEASSPQHAIDFRGELTGSAYFKDWGFDQGFSQNPSMQDGRATFRAEGRLKSPEEESELVASEG